MKTMLVQPAAGLKIRFPEQPDRVLPAEGERVPVNSYWQRRLKSGDVVLVGPVQGGEE